MKETTVYSGHASTAGSIAVSPTHAQFDLLQGACDHPARDPLTRAFFIPERCAHG